MEPQILSFRDEGVGAPLVLLPGGLTGHRSLDPLVPRLAEAGYRVLAVEPIANEAGGRGDVGRPDYDAHVEQESLRLTIESAAPGEAVHLVGWSNGGRAALAYALAQLDQVISVTAVEPPMWWLLPDDPQAKQLQELAFAMHGRDVTEDELLTFLENVRVGPPGTDFRALPTWADWARVRNALSWYGPRMTSSGEAQLSELERLDRPVLLLRGTWTAPWLRAVVDVLSTRLPDVTVQDLEGGHACLLQSQDAFLSCVVAHARGSSIRS